MTAWGYRAAILIFAALTVFGILLALPAPVLAQGRNCAPREVVVERLGTGYGENLIAQALTQGQVMIEVFGQPGGTWTILRTTPDGMSCLLAAGPTLMLHPASEAPEDDDV